MLKEKRSRWSTIGGVIMVIGGGLSTLQGVWGLFNSQPLIPFISEYFSNQPILLRYTFILISLSVTILGIVLAKSKNSPSPVSTTTLNIDKEFRKLLTRTQGTARELMLLKSNADMKWSSYDYGVFVIAGDRYKEAAEILNEDNPLHVELINSLLKGIALIDACKLKKCISEFKSEIDSNSRKIVRQIDGLILMNDSTVKLEIDIHDSGSQSKYDSDGNEHKFDIAFTLKTLRPPIDIARVRLYVQNRRLDALETPFKLDNKIQSHVSKFIADHRLINSIQQDDKYYLSIFAQGKEWRSEEFQLTDMSAVVIPPTANLRVSPSVKAKYIKTIVRNEDSQGK